MKVELEGNKVMLFDLCIRVSMKVLKSVARSRFSGCVLANDPLERTQYEGRALGKGPLPQTKESEQ